MQSVLVTFAPLVAFLVVAVGTYSLFSALRFPTNSLLFPRSLAASFRQRLKGGLGTLVVVTNIFGTLTSLATVYVFFIGTSKVFGAFVFAAPLFMALSFIATNWFTRRVLTKEPSYRKLLEESETASGVVARLVWQPGLDGRVTSWLVKHISLLNLAAVIWLEFSVAADLVQQVNTSANEPWLGPLALFICCFGVVFIIVRYGLRGFVFADLFQSPLVIIATIVILLAVILNPQVMTALATAPVHLLQPQIPWQQGVLFVVHVMLLNIFFVLLTEGHWFRLWLFAGRETTNQWRGTFSTGFIWLLLAIVGCLAVAITTKTGTEGIGPVLLSLAQTHAAFVILFWIGAAAAVFSTADAQIYVFLLVRAFETKTGQIHDKVNRPQHPIGLALLVSLLFAAAYAVTRYYQIPFEKLVFILFPLSLNSLPAFIGILFDRRHRSIWTLFSLAGYTAVSIKGLMDPQNDLLWTLMAALVPFAVVALMLLLQRAKEPSLKRASHVE